MVLTFKILIIVVSILLGLTAAVATTALIAVDFDDAEEDEEDFVAHPVSLFFSGWIWVKFTQEI